MIETQEQKRIQRIYQYIIRNPGCHLSKIAEDLHLTVTTVTQDLQSLEDQHDIIGTQESGYKRFYAIQQKGKQRDKRTDNIRKQIYDIIQRNPGLHLSKIADLLDVSVPLADYHLDQMVKEHRINVIKDEAGYFKRYYATDTVIESQEKKILEVLRKNVPLKIVLLLLKHGSLRHKDLMKQLKISASSTLSYHLTNLVDSGILTVHPHGKERGYELTNPEEVVRILKKYEFKVELHISMERFKSLWDQLSYRETLG